MSLLRDVGFWYAMFWSSTSRLVQGLGFSFGDFTMGALPHSGGGTRRLDLLSSMEIVHVAAGSRREGEMAAGSCGSRFKKGTLQHLRGMTNAGHRSLGSPSDSASPVPNS